MQTGIVGLQYHLSLVTLASCAPCHLSHHGEGVLVGSEVGLVEHGVGGEDADDADAVEVQTFRHHLRADEQVCLA